MTIGCYPTLGLLFGTSRVDCMSWNILMQWNFYMHFAFVMLFLKLFHIPQHPLGMLNFLLHFKL